MANKLGCCRRGCQSPQGGCCCLGHLGSRLKGLLGEPGAVLDQTGRQLSRKSPTCCGIAPPWHQVHFLLLYSPLNAREPLLLTLFLLLSLKLAAAAAAAAAACRLRFDSPSLILQTCCIVQRAQCDFLFVAAAAAAALTFDSPFSLSEFAHVLHVQGGWLHCSAGAI